MLEKKYIKLAITRANLLLHQNNVENFTNESLILLESIIEKDRMFLYTHPDYILNDIQYTKFMELVEKRINGHPLQYLLGFQEFMGLNFTVNPNVLIPRQDTETLVESVLEKSKTFSKEKLFILEIGTGSGCIAISLAHYLKNAYVVTLDISESALNTAFKNAIENNVDERVFFLKSNLFETLNTLTPQKTDFFNRKILFINEILTQKFNFIVSNPPYIPEFEIPLLSRDVRDFEPVSALVGGKDGLDFYRQIIPSSKEYLAPKGILSFEVGYNQANSVKLLMEQSNFNNIRTIKDFNNIDRVVEGSFIK